MKTSTLSSLRQFFTRLLSRLRPLADAPAAAWGLLLAVTLLSYGFNLPYLGFYWDSWAMNWIAQTRGTAGLAQYFSTNRPVWGLLYQLTTPLLGSTPLPWQLLALGLRWLFAGALWGLMRLLWPQRRNLAIWLALLSIVYPGFQQQSIGFLYSHFYLVMIALVGSFSCSLLAMRRPGQRWAWLGAGLALSAANLLMMEYFFLLEALRPVFLWFALESQPRRWRRLLAAWAPYLVLFAAAAIWRAFLFPYTTNNYKISLLSQLASQPLQAVLGLASRALSQIWIALGQAWIFAGHFWWDGTEPNYMLVRYGLIASAVVLGLVIFGWLSSPNPRPQRAGWQPLLLAAAGLAVAGMPFWMTDLRFSLDFAFDRFTLPFLFGACLLLAALLDLLRWRWLAWLALAGLMGLGAAFQTQTQVAYRQDWQAQQRFFWQLSWRAPSIRPGTLIIANENTATAYSTDNSLTAPLNWIYDPQNHSQSLRYLLAYPTVRQYGMLPELKKNVPVHEDYLVATFEGSTTQSFALYFDANALYYGGNACLRVLDPVIDRTYPVLSDDLRAALEFSDLSLIQPLPSGQDAPAPLPAILGMPPAESWCYYYEKADLARQLKQWESVLKIWEKAKPLANQANFDGELTPFVEALARTGSWQPAAGLTPISQKSRPIYCNLWQSLDQSAPQAAGKTQAVQDAMGRLRCQEFGISPSQR